MGSWWDLENWPQEWQVGAVAVGSNGRSGSQELLKEQKVPPVPAVGWATAGGELLTQHRMSVGWEGGVLEKNFEHFCRKKFCKQLCLISVSAQMWVLVVCKVCSGRGQQGKSSVMDTGDVLLPYRKKDLNRAGHLWAASGANSEHCLVPACGGFSYNKCVYFMLPVITSLEALWKQIVLDLLVEKLSKMWKLRGERTEGIL